MAEKVQLRRQLTIPSSLKTSQIDDLKVNFKTISNKQNDIRGGLSRLIEQIFEEYKYDIFQNQNNLNLYKSYNLLKNISNNNQFFVKYLKTKQSEIQDVISKSVDDAIQQTVSDDKQYYEKLTNFFKTHKLISTKNSKDISTRLVQILNELLKEYQKEQNDNNTETSQDNTEQSNVLDNKIRDSFISEIKTKNVLFLSANTIQKYNEKVLSGVLQTQKSIYDKVLFKNNVINTKQKDKSENKEPKLLSFLRFKKDESQNAKIDSNIFGSKTFGLFSNTKNLKKKYLKISDTFEKKLTTQVSKLIPKTSNRILGSIFGFVWSAFSGIFSFCKSSIKFLWGIGTKIVSGVLNMVGGMIGGILKSNIFNMLIKFLLTPAGAYVCGYITGIFKNKLLEFTDSTGITGLVRKAMKGVKYLYGYIKDFFKVVNFRTLFNYTTVIGSTVLIPFLKLLLDELNPEVLKTRMVNKVAGNIVGFGLNFVKGPALAIMAPFAAFGCIFVAMSNQLSDIMDKVHTKDKKNKTGAVYAGRLSYFRNLKNTHDTRSSGFLTTNEEFLRKYTGERIDSTSLILADALNFRIKENANKASEQKVLDFIEDESKKLQKEKDKIAKDANSKDAFQKNELAFPIEYLYDGKKVNSSILPKDTPNSIELRVKNLIMRTQLLALLKKGIQGGTGINSIEEYQEKANGLINIHEKNGKYIGEIQTLKIGEGKNSITVSPTVYDVDTNDIRGYTGPRTVGGFEAMQENAYYGYKKASNLGAQDWQDSERVGTLLNFSIGKITDDMTSEIEMDEEYENYLESVYNEAVKETKALGQGVPGLFTKAHIEELIHFLINMCLDKKSTILTDNNFNKLQDTYSYVIALLSCKRLRDCGKEFKRIKYKGKDVWFDVGPDGNIEIGDATYHEGRQSIVRNTPAYWEYSDKRAIENFDKKKFKDFLKDIVSNSKIFKSNFYDIFKDYIGNIYRNKATIVSAPNKIIDGKTYAAMVNFWQSRHDSSGQIDESYMNVVYRYKLVEENRVKQTIENVLPTRKDKSLSNSDFNDGGQRFCFICNYSQDDNKNIKTITYEHTEVNVTYVYKFPLVVFSSKNYDATCNNMIYRFIGLMSKLIEKYLEIQDSMDEGENTMKQVGIEQMDRLTQLENAFDQGETMLSKTIDALDVSPSEIEDLDKKIDYLKKEINDNITAFVEEYKARSDKIKGIVQASTEAKKNGISNSSGEQTDTDNSVTVVQGQDNTSLNDSITSARQRSERQM